MKRWFNTDGVCLPDYHYMVPAAQRLPRLPELIAELRYAGVHAPRQTGKTTAIQAMAAELTASGRYAAARFSCEVGEAGGGDYVAAQRSILDKIRESAGVWLPEELRPPPWPAAADLNLLGAALRAWAEACPRPLVLFFDEIDSLQGASLVSVLRQLRDGHSSRPAGFPSSVVLCGMRDLRDYRAAAGSDPSSYSWASCSGWSMEGAMCSGSTGWAGAGSTCWSSGRTRVRTGSGSASGRRSS